MEDRLTTTQQITRGATETVRQPLEAPFEVTSRSRGLLMRCIRARRHQLVALLLMLSDALFAFLVWKGATSSLNLWGEGASAVVSGATVASNVAVWVVLRYLVGLYPGYGLEQTEELRRQTHTSFATLAVITIYAAFSHIGGFSSNTLVVLGLVVLGLLVLAPLLRHFVKRGLNTAGLWGKPVVILSSGEAGGHLARLLKKEWGLGLMPTAIFDGRVIPKEGVIEGVPYGGTVAEAMDLGGKGGADTAIFAMPYTRRERLLKFFERARLNFKHVIITPNLAGITNSAVVARNLAGIFGVEIRHNLLDPSPLRAKRILDLAATVVGGALVLPLLLALSLLVWLESGGPIFYRDQRMGRDDKPFTCLKFRTMVPDAETALQRLLAEDPEMNAEYSRYHKLREDPRVTHVGRFLRKTSLDELPQLWNVLKGDMSLVGPRPYLPRESADIGTCRRDILRVYPGITGPWQVNGRNHASFEERTRMDVLYVHNWSIWLDIVLLTRTVRAVVFDRGAY